MLNVFSNIGIFFPASILHRCLPLDSASFFFFIYSNRTKLLPAIQPFNKDSSCRRSFFCVSVPEQDYLVSGHYRNIPNSKRYHNILENFISEEKDW